MKSHDHGCALSTLSVSKNFSGVQAVRQVDLSVPVGERRALIGPNGAGKSTLFNLITGELAADQGRIEVFGIDVTKMPVQGRARLGLGRTYQISQLFLDLTVEESLFLAGTADSRIHFTFFRPWDGYRRDREWAEKVAVEVGLEDKLKVQVRELSHGLQRQLELGLAIAMRPRLILLDEPAAGLSPGERLTLTTLITKLPKDITLILIEHDMEIVLDIADRISVLNHGSLIVEDTPAGIKSNREVQQIYLGSSYA